MRRGCSGPANHYLQGAQGLSFRSRNRSRPDTEQRVVRQDEQRAVALTTKHELQGPFGDIDPPELPAVRTINEDLPVRDIDPTVGTDRNAFPTAIRERPQIGDLTMRADKAAIGAVL